MSSLDILIQIIFPILSIIIPVWATVYTVNKRIKAQTHENHQPHLVLDSINTIEEIDKHKYYLTLFGNSFKSMNPSFNAEDVISKTDNILNIDIMIKNIGYGVATNIKFYDLFNGRQVYGTQIEVENQNQRLFTTFDIGMNEEKKVSSQVICLKDSEDLNTVLCVYKDLNNIVDSFIITLNQKKNNYYNYSAYQPSSISYKKLIKKYKKQYNKIIERYVNL